MAGLPGIIKGRTQRELIVWEDDLGQNHVVNADVVVSLSDTQRADVTGHAIEDGTEVVDHIIQQPDEISITLAHSNTPILEDEDFKLKQFELDVVKSTFKPQGLFAITSGVTAAVGGLLGKINPLKVYTLQSDSQVNRIADLHDALIEVKRNGYLCTITFKGRLYVDFVFTRVVLSYEQGKGGLGNFQIEARNVRTVKTKNVEGLPDPADLRAKEQKKKGKSPTKQLEDAQKAAVRKSLLAGGLDSIAGGIAGG